MKDICDNEIKAGQMVHIWWAIPGQDEYSDDILCTVVRTRGRGIKFVSDDGREFTKEQLEERNAQIAIQGSQQIAKEEQAPLRSEPAVTPEELLMISKLRDNGWYGTLYKKTMKLSTFRIEMPELQDK